MTLKATRPVLIGSTQYRVGDQLPSTNESLVAAWIDAGSAVWVDDEEQTTATTAKAIQVALAGLPGKSSDGDPDAMVGKVSARKKTTTRTRAKK